MTSLSGSPRLPKKGLGKFTSEIFKFPNLVSGAPPYSFIITNPHHWEIYYVPFKPRKLGEGSFTLVAEIIKIAGKILTGPLNYALKIPRPNENIADKELFSEMIVKEYDILNQVYDELKCEHIPGLPPRPAVFIKERGIYVTEIFDHTLWQELYSTRLPPSQALFANNQFILQAFNQLFFGLSKLHQFNKYHGDIKPHNIGIVVAEKRIYLNDFNLSGTSTIIPKELGGTNNWILLADQTVWRQNRNTMSVDTFKSLMYARDILALAASLYRLVDRKPFALDLTGFIKGPLIVDERLVAKIFGEDAPVMTQIFKDCFEEDFTKRPSAKTVLDMLPEPN